MKIHKQSNKHKYLILSILIIIVSVSVVCKFLFFSTPSSQEENPVGGPFGYGYAIQVTNENSTDADKEFARLIQKKSTDALNINFTNASGADTEFLVKVFYNYQETDFKVISTPVTKQFDNDENGNDLISLSNVDTETDFINDYQFDLANGMEISIPIKLSEDTPSEKEHAKLIVAVFAAPNKYEKEVQLMDDFYGIAAVYNMIYVENSHFIPIIDDHLFHKAATLDTERFPNTAYYGIVVNTESNMEKYSNGIPFPPHNLKVKRGEDISLNYVVGDPHGGTENHFVIISLLGWKQVAMNNQANFPIEIEPQKTALDTFIIQAPDEPGLYEYVALMLPVRNKFVTDGTALEQVDISFSYRFTIEVE